MGDDPTCGMEEKGGGGLLTEHVTASGRTLMVLSHAGEVLSGQVSGGGGCASGGVPFASEGLRLYR